MLPLLQKCPHVRSPFYKHLSPSLAFSSSPKMLSDPPVTPHLEVCSDKKRLNVNKYNSDVLLLFIKCLHFLQLHISDGKQCPFAHHCVYLMVHYVVLQKKKIRRLFFSLCLNKENKQTVFVYHS